MDSKGIRLFAVAEANMRYQAQRQGVLSENISNVDTPGYKAKDLKPLDFGKLAAQESRRLEMRGSSPAHLSGAYGLQGPYRVDKLDDPYEMTPVKNSVSIEQQMGNVNTTAANFQLSSTLYRKTGQLFKTALGTR